MKTYWIMTGLVCAILGFTFHRYWLLWDEFATAKVQWEAAKAERLKDDDPEVEMMTVEAGRPENSMECEILIDGEVNVYLCNIYNKKLDRHYTCIHDYQGIDCL